MSKVLTAEELAAIHARATGGEGCYSASQAYDDRRQLIEHFRWQPIATAPQDGTIIDLWVEDQGRFTDCHWGNTEHTCGEAGQYCDSEWHGEKPGWCWGTLNEQITGVTHWMPRPADPV